MPRQSIDYVPRDPSGNLLYQIVHDHFETFRVQAAHLRDGDGLPAFVDEEFRGFLRCGWLAGGFARFRCGSCGLDRLVAFSCKGRGFCPSCGGRRMAERAAHLVDAVLPDVPVRQWVLSLPYRLRYQLAWRHDVCRGVIRVFMAAVLRQLRDIARQAGGRGGGVAIIQRFGGALNLNIHVHALVLDGVFAPAPDGRLRFHAVPLTDLDVAEVLATVEAQVMRLAEREGLGARADADEGDAWAETPVLGGLAAASVQGTQALGEAAGRRVRRLATGGAGDEADIWVRGPYHARANGFDLHAGVRVAAGQRDRLEAVCRYALRPPVSGDRVRLTAEGQVLLELRHRWADGTTHLVFEPLEFLGRLAVLVPRPRVNLLFYYGVLGARAAWRPHIVPARAGPFVAAAPEPASTAAAKSSRGYLWAELMRRTFGFDVLACSRCRGRLRLVALIEQGPVGARILAHLGLPTEVAPPAPARPPPELSYDDW